MDDIGWKCTAAFFLGIATHYFVSSHVLSDNSSSAALSTEKHTSASNSSSSSSSSSTNDEAAASGASPQSSASSSDDWQVEELVQYTPHKMVMCVRTDLKTGKGSSPLLR